MGPLTWHALKAIGSAALPGASQVHRVESADLQGSGRGVGSALPGGRPGRRSVRRFNLVPRAFSALAAAGPGADRSADSTWHGVAGAGPGADRSADSTWHGVAAAGPGADRSADSTWHG